MSPTTNNPQSALPDSLRVFLSTGGEAIEAHARLSNAMDGSREGETHLVLIQGRLLLFTRGNQAEPFSEVLLAPGGIPVMEERSHQNLLVLTSAAGEELQCPVSFMEEQDVQGLINQLLGIGSMGDYDYDDDLEDAPTEVMEQGLGHADNGIAAWAMQPDDSLPEVVLSEAMGPEVMEPEVVVPGEMKPLPPLEEESILAAGEVPLSPVAGEVPAPEPPQPAAILPDDPYRTAELTAEDLEEIVVEAADKLAARVAPSTARPPRLVKTVFSGADLHKRFQVHIHKDNNLDAAFCVAASLVFMRKAKEGVRIFYDHHRPRELQHTDMVITEEMWRTLVVHQEEDPAISARMALLSPVVSRTMAHPIKAFGLKQEDRRDVTTDLLQISRVFGYASQALGVGPVNLFVHPDKAEGFLFANTRDVLSFVAGADMLRGRHENELTFTVTRHLSLIKPQYVLCNLMPSSSQLRQVVLAAIKLFIPKLPIAKAERARVESLRKLMKKQLPAQAKEQVRALVSGLVSQKGTVDLDSWLFHVHLTADRAALLLCQDLNYAAKMVKASPELKGVPSANRRLQDLVRYALSKEYATIRRNLGLTLAQG